MQWNIFYMCNVLEKTIYYNYNILPFGYFLIILTIFGQI